MSHFLVKKLFTPVILTFHYMLALASYASTKIILLNTNTDGDQYYISAHKYKRSQESKRRSLIMNSLRTNSLSKLLLSET